MPQTITEPRTGRAVLPSDLTLKQAKADLQMVRKAETYRILIGAAIKRARLRVRPMDPQSTDCGWTLKDASREFGKDERQIARWESGEDRAPLDLLMAHDEFRPKLKVALCEVGDDNIEVETIVRIPERRKVRV